MLLLPGCRVKPSKTQSYTEAPKQLTTQLADPTSDRRHHKGTAKRPQSDRRHHKATAKEPQTPQSDHKATAGSLCLNLIRLLPYPYSPLAPPTILPRIVVNTGCVRLLASQSHHVFHFRLPRNCRLITHVLIIVRVRLDQCPRPQLANPCFSYREMKSTQIPKALFYKRNSYFPIRQLLLQAQAGLYSGGKVISTGQPAILRL
jgi:hypothetical protein